MVHSSGNLPNDVVSSISTSGASARLLTEVSVAQAEGSVSRSRPPQRFAEFSFRPRPACKSLLELLLCIIQHDRLAVLCVTAVNAIDSGHHAEY